MATITSPRSESPAVGLSRITSPTITIDTGGANGASSVRPSLDIPRTGTRSPSPAPPQLQHGSATASPSASVTAHRRNRAALRDYYNLKGRGPHGQAQDHNHNLSLSRTTSMASNASDSTITSTVVPWTEPLSSSSAATGGASSLTARLDEPSFDAESYVSELLKTAGLRDILQTESILVGEIRNLDGERKSLVYDNYSKLIKAVGTIAEMQKGMHKREQEQDKFGIGTLPAGSGVGIGIGINKEQAGQSHNQTQGLDGVEKLAEKLDGLLRVARDLAPATEPDRSRRLVEARKQARQKETVKWALAAPARLQAILERGHGHEDEALEEYKTVMELLDHWKDVGGVDELRAKCDKIIHAVTTVPNGQEQAWRNGVDASG